MHEYKEPSCRSCHWDEDLSRPNGSVDFIYEHQKAETWDFTTLKKVSAEIMRFCQNIPTPLLDSFFKKSQVFSLFPAYNVIGVSCGHDFLLHQRSRSDGPLEYTEYDLQVTENFLDVFGKKSHLKKWGRKLKIEVGIFWKVKKHRILYRKFVTKTPICSVTLRACSVYLRVLSDQDLCLNKKKRDHATRQWDYIPQKSEKNWDFKKWSSKWIRNTLIKPHGLSWNLTNSWGLVKSASQTVCQSNTNWVLLGWKVTRPRISTWSEVRFLISFCRL